MNKMEFNRIILNRYIFKLAKHCLKLVNHQSEQYHYYMALCEYKKRNYLASLEHLKSDKLIEKYVSSN